MGDEPGGQRWLSAESDQTFPRQLHQNSRALRGRAHGGRHRESNGTFIGGLDFIWARLGAGVDFQNPTSSLFGAHANITLNEFIVTGFGGLRIPDRGHPNLELYGTVGARYFNLRSEAS